MPELPEVENLRRGLERRVVGQKINKVRVSKPKLVSAKGNGRTPSARKVREFERGLAGETIAAVERRAKNLVFKMKSGKLILVHLKMTGQFVYREHGRNLLEGGHPIELSDTELPNKHTHVIFELAKGTLYYQDTRMFGYLLYYPDAASFEKENHFGGLGLEPLDPDFTPEYFRAALKARKGRLKAVLMDQKVVTGLGNIYADEAAFEAGIRPTRSVATLKPEEVKKLYAAVVRIIPAAIELGGSSVASYRLLDLTRGNYAREHKVYGRTGMRCARCKGSLKTIQVNNRTTVFCPSCQR
jgi:formamidopyrimidine-DNA glycosylase